MCAPIGHTHTYWYKTKKHHLSSTSSDSSLCGFYSFQHIYILLSLSLSLLILKQSKRKVEISCKILASNKTKQTNTKAEKHEYDYKKRSIHNQKIPLVFFFCIDTAEQALSPKIILLVYMPILITHYKNKYTYVNAMFMLKKKKINRIA